MTMEQPRFPTPEDERRAALLYAALRRSVDIDNATAGAPGEEQSTEADSSVSGIDD